MLAEAPRHGYQLVEAAQESGLSWGHPTSLYRALRRLEAAGLLRAQWSREERVAPARKVYSLTQVGEAELRSCAERAERLAAFLDDYRARYRAVAGDKPRAKRRSRHSSS
jgi:PadR family transcriptional regulator PadR